MSASRIVSIISCFPRLSLLFLSRMASMGYQSEEFSTPKGRCWPAHYEGRSPELSLEFPWNVYGFRDILLPKHVVGKWEVLWAPEEAVGVLPWVARFPTIVLNIPGMVKDTEWKLRSKKSRRLRSWRGWS